MMASLSRFSCLFLALLFAGTISHAGSNAPDMSVVQRWLATNSGVGALKIDFTQTRRMRSVKRASSQDGTLWLDYQNHRFRWQTGDPATTIVVSLGSNLLIIRTPGKRYEVRKAGSGGGAPGMAALANGFPRTLAEFKQRYHVLETRSEANTRRIITKPLGESGRGVDTFTFVIDSTRFRLLGIEIDLEDGSALHTVFRQVEVNPKLTPELFQPSVDGYTQTTF
jgi:outer membrane lipoprotein-sorting protein